MIKVVDTRIISSSAPADAGVLPIQKPYSMHTTGALDPGRVEARWERTNNGEWQLVRLTVSGRKLKKDGSPGLNEGTTHFVYYGQEWLAERPEWVANVVAFWSPVSIFE